MMCWALPELGQLATSGTGPAEMNNHFEVALPSEGLQGSTVSDVPVAPRFRAATSAVRGEWAAVPRADSRVLTSTLLLQEDH
jgi:hypothetical protein